ncbi:uncharacterized protein LOC122664515 [Telopea speciosissima]|uniref:uncharacterized protein LOC122664515 n=1 Tax=Telopea speciosissima TaxID=54955 RepID=UPI001CC5FE08|nr:uncharacterized protein LOC122664515 [Telopea speciosissima]
MVDASCGGTFMHKSENEAWQLFETLSENSLHHVSASRTEPTTTGPQKRGGLYKAVHSTQTCQEACTLCASPAHYLSDCPLAVQFPEYVQEQAQAAQNFSKPGQLVDAISRREEGQLPSQVVGNPNSQPNNQVFHEQAKAVMTLRTGRVLGTAEQSSPAKNSKKDVNLEPSLEASQASKDHEIDQFGKDSNPDVYMPRAPFPSCLESPSSSAFGKKSARMEEMMELFKQVSAVLSNPLPPKVKDPGAPLLAYTIENLRIERAFFDLGASVNIFPSSVNDHFGFGELKPTKVILQLADRSIKVPRGFIEDVLVKVDELYFPVGFLVLDMEKPTNGKPPLIILGRPFLATANAYIN